MGAHAEDLFSTEDGRLALSEAEGWVLMTVADTDGNVTEKARMELSELLLSVQVIKACLEAIGAGSSRPVEVLLGFMPEGEQLYATVAQYEMTIMEVARDGAGRRLLCGPYPLEEAHRMVEAVVKASAG